MMLKHVHNKLQLMRGFLFARSVWVNGFFKLFHLHCLYKHPGDNFGLNFQNFELKSDGFGTFYYIRSTCFRVVTLAQSSNLPHNRSIFIRVSHWSTFLWTTWSQYPKFVLSMEVLFVDPTPCDRKTLVSKS